MNYQRTSKYFEEINNKGLTKVMIGGIVAALVGIMAKAWILVILGILLAAGMVYLMQNKKKQIVTDAEYDSEVAKNLDNLKQRALDKLGLDEDEVKEIAPITFDGYVYKGASLSKLGADNLWRTNKYETVYLFFAENEVHCYNYTFDTTTPKFTESTDVYFYKDIVSVSTASDTVTLGNQNIEYEYFKLTTAGGTALSVSLKDANGAQRSINAMRALLRSKKA
ncbi:MAG: hypothetical protein IJR36_09360 [Lachnospiraceae bacterium]|nr:hypothetical protein [Lachnospiraceae bacterium]MBQ9594067.1 hypothetical protein [Lachnospiraceae bacterium]